MDRKTFLRMTTGAALAGTAYIVACRDEPATGLDAPPGQRTLPAIGLQLYTIRQMMVNDMAGALSSVAEAGYTEVEFAGYFDHTPEQVRDLVQSVGLDPVAAHVDIAEFRQDAAGLIAAAGTVGHRYLVVPYLSEEERTLEGYRALAADLNRFGAMCADAGIQIGYHNHAFEFESLDGTRGFDVLLEETDPALVTFELDFFWIAEGGGDIGATLETHLDRFRLCHVKGRDLSGRMVDVGLGTMLWPQYFERAKGAGMQHFFVEHDAPEDPMKSIQQSHAYLANLTF